MLARKNIQPHRQGNAGQQSSNPYNAGGGGYGGGGQQLSAVRANISLPVTSLLASVAVFCRPCSAAAPALQDLDPRATPLHAFRPPHFAASPLSPRRPEASQPCSIALPASHPTLFFAPFLPGPPPSHQADMKKKAYREELEAQIQAKKDKARAERDADRRAVTNSNAVCGRRRATALKRPDRLA